MKICKCGHKKTDHEEYRVQGSSYYQCKKCDCSEFEELKKGDERCIVILYNKKRNCNSPRKKGSQYCARHSKLWDKKEIENEKTN